jgi:AraC-like DNA-binding protein
MSYIDISLLIAATVGGLLIAALLFRRDNRKANLLLSAVIAAGLCFQYLASLKATGEIVKYPLLWRSTFPIAVLVNILLYLYVLALTVPGFKISRRHLLYFLPLVFALLWYGALQFVPHTSPLWTDPQWILMERYCRSVFAFLIKSFFLYVCFRQLHQYRKHVKLYFSELRRVRLQWLEALLLIFSVPWLVRGFDVVTGPFVTVEEFAVPLIAGFILLIGFLGLRQSAIFTSEEAAVEEMVPSKGLTFFTEEELAQWKVKLEGFMTQQKPYLNPELRLIDLAKGLRIKAYMVSEILNRGLGVTFYNYVNGFRVAEAKTRLTDPNLTHMNILGIATDSGFNSKSVFNEVFRKTTGITPSEFRKGAPLSRQAMH